MLTTALIFAVCAAICALVTAGVGTPRCIGLCLSIVGVGVAYANS